MFAGSMPPSEGKRGIKDDFGFWPESLGQWWGPLLRWKTKEGVASALFSGHGIFAVCLDLPRGDDAAVGPTDLRHWEEIRAGNTTWKPQAWESI